MRSNWPNRIIQVRHGQSVRNAAKGATMAFYDIKEAVGPAKGIPDHLIPLTEIGIQQAIAAGKGICQKYPDIDVAMDSGYLRVAETRKLVLDAYPEAVRNKIQLVQDVGIRERVSGWAFDMYSHEAPAAFPWLEAYWRLFGHFFSQPPGGESVADAIDRREIFTLKLRMDFAGKNILIAEHGREIACSRHILEGWTWQETEKFIQPKNPDRPKNCGVTVYEYSEELDRMKLVEYNTVFAPELDREGR